MIIVTYYNNKYAPIADLTVPIMKEYGKRWGIPVMTYNYEVSHPPHWEKLNCVIRHLQFGSTVMWLDVDAIIQDMEYDVNNLTRIFNYELILNNGTAMFVVKPSALDIMLAWRSCGGYGNTPPHYDMPILSGLIDNFPKINERCLKLRSMTDPRNHFDNAFVAFGWTNADGVEKSLEYLKSRCPSQS